MEELGTSTAQLMSNSAPSHMLQYFTALSVTMGALSFGMGLGYTSPAGPLLLANSTDSTDGSLTITKNELMLFSSIINLGAMVGGPVGGLLINAVGRKGTMLGSIILNIGSWALIAFAQNFAMLMSGRIIAGLYTGITSLVVPTYIGEIASTDVRGSLGSSFQLMVVIGILFAYLFGAVVPHWRGLAGICAIPALIYGIMVFFVKESPTYLVAKGKEKEAREALQALRGKHYNIEPEFQSLRETQEEMSRSSVSLRDLLVPYILKPVLICLATMFFQQTSGVNAVLFNLGTIFEETGTDISEDLSTILVGVVQVIATAISVPLVDRAGRKILLTGSAAVMALSLVALGVSFYEKSEGVTISWLPLTSLILYIAAFSIGYGPVPWVLMSEMFTLEVRAAASGLATLSNWGTAFIVTLIYDPLKDALEDYGVYWMFGGICVINTVFCLLMVPETKGKTVQEITAHFGGPAPQVTKLRAATKEQHVITVHHIS